MSNDQTDAVFSLPPSLPPSQCGSVNIRIVVMNNLLPSNVKFQEKYDLKGSTYKRRANTAELAKMSPTFKDLDFAERHEEVCYVIQLLDLVSVVLRRRKSTFKLCSSGYEHKRWYDWLLCPSLLVLPVQLFLVNRSHHSPPYSIIIHVLPERLCTKM